MSHEATRKRWAESTIIPGFRREHPEITVELLTVPWAEHESTLLAMSAAGNTPDVFSQDGQVGAATFLQQKLLRPLDDMIDKYGWDLGNIPENSRRLWTFNGKLYGVPMFILGSFIFFNRDHFDQARMPYPPTDWDDPSWTWDEMIRRAQALTKNLGNPDTAQYGLYIAMPDLYPGVPWLFGADVWLASDYAKGIATSIDLSTPSVVAAIQAKADLMNSARVSPSAAAVDALT